MCSGMIERFCSPYSMDILHATEVGRAHLLNGAQTQDREFFCGCNAGRRQKWDKELIGNSEILHHFLMRFGAGRTVKGEGVPLQIGKVSITQEARLDSG